LPATKSQPKEMLPVARKPIVQYVVEELVANGIREILFITGRNKTSIENHFDADPILEGALRNKAGLDPLGEVYDLANATILYTRQREQRGLGDAILCGRSFAGEQAVAVALGDSILGLHAKSTCVARMIEMFEEQHASCVIAVEEVPREHTSHYGIIRTAENGDSWYRVRDLVEKPAPEEAPSNLAIAGRYVFSPTIFDYLNDIAPDSHGEIQLTDAIQRMCEEGRRVLAYRLPPNERRYDIGNFPSYFATFVEFALADPEFGPGVREAMERVLRKP